MQISSIFLDKECMSWYRLMAQRKQLLISKICQQTKINFLTTQEKFVQSCESTTREGFWCPSPIDRWTSHGYHFWHKSQSFRLWSPPDLTVLWRWGCMADWSQICLLTLQNGNYQVDQFVCGKIIMLITITA